MGKVPLANDPGYPAAAMQTDPQSLVDDLLSLLDRAGRQSRLGQAEATKMMPWLRLALDAALELPPDSSAKRPLGTALAQSRRQLGMTQAQLAERAGVSERTVKNVESGTGSPSSDTLARLAFVAQLVGENERKDNDSDLRANSWLAPSYDPGHLVEELLSTVNSQGGTVEQSLLYVDAPSAINWLQVSRTSRMVSFWDACPLRELAADATSALGGGVRALEIVALGCGDARNEVRFTLAMRDCLPDSDLRLRLLDISHILLAAAQSEAQLCLSGARVDVKTLHANFHRLTRYPELAQSTSSRPPRIWTLLGYTVSNLDDEAEFFQNLAVCSRTGDLALLDIQLACAPADDPEAIQRLDPGLRQDYKTEDYFQWMTGPFRRHMKGFERSDASRVLGISSVPGSYTINWQAEISLRSGEVRNFVMGKFKRFDPEQLAAWLLKRGWQHVITRRYGISGTFTSAAMLLRRTEPAEGQGQRERG